MEEADGELPSSKTCGSCGRTGTDLKICTACRLVHYCNVTCQKAHRKAHKDDCKVMAHAKEVMKEFKANPMTEECPLCMRPLPLGADESRYRVCCGKVICDGCAVAHRMAQSKLTCLVQTQQVQVLPLPCPFCRCPYLICASDEEELELYAERAEKHGDSTAVATMAALYREGKIVQKDDAKAFECYIKASDMGNPHGMYNAGVSYLVGTGVSVDKERAKAYFEMAARKGHVLALMGLFLVHTDNHNEVAILYKRLAAENGDEEAMESLKKGYRLSTDGTSNHSNKCLCDVCKIIKTEGLLTKEDLAATIRAFHAAQKELRSDERDFARGLAERVRLG